MIERAVQQSPDAIAVRNTSGRAVTFAELDASSDRLAVLLQSVGVKPGTRVGVFMQRSPGIAHRSAGRAQSGRCLHPD